MKTLIAGFHTLGCKVNQYETDAVIEEFEKSGFRIGQFDEFCHIYVINTCTVTAEAARKSGQFIRRARRLNPEALVLAMGCHVQIGPKNENADLVLGTSDKLRAPELVLDFLENKKSDHPHHSSLAGLRQMTEYEEMGPVSSFDGSRAFIKIQDGCDRFCSYCIIPFARGKSRSRLKADVLREVEGIAESGIKELVLTGIDLSAYGADFGLDHLALADLLKDIDKIKGLERIRLGSLDPFLLSENFIQRLAESSKLCPHFHLSLQSGSDTVLQRMKRDYDTESFALAVSRFRKYFPGAKITVDLISGFPGESQEEHLDTFNFCRQMNFLDMHVFKYSRREGTAASRMKGQVASDVMNSRSKELMELAADMKAAHLEEAVGSQKAILAERFEKDEKSGSYLLRGYSEDYLPAVLEIEDPEKKSHLKAGEIIKTRISNSDKGYIYGKI